MEVHDIEEFVIKLLEKVDSSSSADVKISGKYLAIVPPFWDQVPGWRDI